MREDAETAVKEMNGGSFGDGKGRRLGVEWAGKRVSTTSFLSSRSLASKGLEGFRVVQNGVFQSGPSS